LGLGIRDFLSMPARSILQVYIVWMIGACIFYQLAEHYLFLMAEPYWTYYRHGTRQH
jgi:hypothetical protein